MCKKIAEGIDALVLDVKAGIGAFMTEYEQAHELARNLIRIGENAGKKTVAYITDMNTPLGNTVGNWLEVKECIDCLHGNGPEDLMYITHVLAGTMIYLGQQASNIDEGIEISKRNIKNGGAWKKFIDIVKEQEGDVSVLHNPEIYPPSLYNINYNSPTSGWIKSINAYETGMIGILLGGGRLKQNDELDFKAGVRFYAKPGDKVRSGQKLFTIYTDKKEVIEQAKKSLAQSIIISKHSVEPPKLILNYLDKSNL
jgi:pyrimidine-nucleoside phosphorylase